MKIKAGKLYFIKDEFLEKYGKKYNLMDNKIEKGTKRPTYFCFKDDKNTDLLWFVPMSKQYEKYLRICINIKLKIKKEPNNFVFCNNIAGSKGVFLIQNMFPTAEEYVQAEYLRKGQEIKIPKTVQQEILEKAKNVIALANREIVATYTNLPAFIKDIEYEISSKGKVKYEGVNEITVKLKCGASEIDKILKDKGFNVTKRGYLEDTYFIPKEICLKDKTAREILNKGILLRNIEEELPTERRIYKLTYKQKEINNERNHFISN